MSNPNQLSFMTIGDTVGLVTPASFITKDKLDQSVENIENFGLKALYYTSITDKKGYLAGNDQDRRDELHKMYKNKSVKAILCVRGGYGSARILDLLDYNIIKDNPKPIIGYSDITALLHAIYIKTNIPGFHGIVGASKLTKYTRDNFKNVFLNKDNTIITESNKKKNNSYIIHHGHANGILIGGNLSILVSLIGTQYDINWKDKIIFIEEVNEPPYKIDRMLTQLSQAGKFKEIKGIILGNFYKCDPKDFEIKSEDSLSLNEIISDKIKPLKVPSVCGFSFGHTDDQAIFPFGIEVQFDAEKFQISFKREVFQDFF